MSEVSIQTLSPQRVVSAVLRQLNQEQIKDAVACFTTDFQYKDHGLGRMSVILTMHETTSAGGYPMVQSGQEHERKRERYKENSL
jgi:limonene-1,2-epoxide hydrolase